MSNIEYHKELISIIEPIEQAKFDTDYIEVENSAENRLKCTELKIDTEEIKDRLRLFPDSIKTKIFRNNEEFLTCNEIKDTSDFLIINSNYRISYIENKTYVNFQLQPNNFLITNQKAYLDFLDYLKKCEKDADDTFCFVDFYDRNFRKICFITLSDKGRVIINYDLKAPEFNYKKDLSPGFDKFRACFAPANKNLPKFLKAALVEAAYSYPTETRIQLLIENLVEIVQKAQKNFEVYLNNLSIDKIKTEYDDVKTKYFDNLSEILSKLSQKIIALPIGISASLIAIFNVKNEPGLLIFLIAAILVTSIYISLLLRVHLKDLRDIIKTFLEDYNKLTGNYFFIKYPEEKRTFEDIKERFNDRVRFLKIIVESYYWVMNTANIITIAFAMDLLNVSLSAIIIIVLVCAFILVSLRNYVINEDFNGINEKES